MPLINLFKEYGPDAELSELSRLLREVVAENRQDERTAREEERAAALDAQDTLAQDVAERPIVVRPPEVEGAWEDLGNLEQGIPRDVDLANARQEGISEDVPEAPGPHTEVTLDNVGMFLDGGFDVLRTDEGMNIPTWEDEEEEGGGEEDEAREDEVELESDETDARTVSTAIQIRNMNTVEDIYRGTPAWEAGHTMGLREMLVTSEAAYTTVLFKKHYFFLCALVMWLSAFVDCDERPPSMEIANESAHHRVHHAAQKALIESMRSGGSHAIDP